MDVTIIPVALQPSLGVDDLAPTPGAADAGAVARFSELMTVPDAADGVDAPAAVEAAAPTGTATLGDNILGGLQHLSTELQQTWSSVGSALNGAGALGMQDLLKMQLGLSQMSVQYELVGKAVSRSTQNLDQLVKLQ